MNMKTLLGVIASMNADTRSSDTSLETYASLENLDDSSPLVASLESTSVNMVETLQDNGLIHPNMNAVEEQALRVGAENAALATSADFDAGSFFKAHNVATTENFDDGLELDYKEATIFANAANGFPDILNTTINSLFTPVAVGAKAALKIESNTTVLTNHRVHQDGELMVNTRRPISDLLTYGSSLGSLKLFPVRGGDFDSVLVDPADVPPTTLVIDEEDVEVSPILFGEALDFIGLAQAGNSNIGVMSTNATTLDRTSKLSSFLIKTDGAIFSFNTLADPSALLQQSQQGLNTNYILHYNGEVVFRPDTLDIAGAPLANALADITTNNLTVITQVNITGDLNTETGNTTGWSFNSVRVTKVYNAAGEELALTDAAVAPIVAAIDASEGVGYYPELRYSQSDLSTNAILLDNDTRNAIVPVQVQPSVEVRAPSNGQLFARSDSYNRLVLASRYAKAHAVIEMLEQSYQTVEAYSIAGLQHSTVMLGLLGGRHVNATHLNTQLDLSTDLNSVSTANRGTEVPALIVGTLRNMADTLLSVSGLDLALTSQYGSESAYSVEFVVVLDKRLVSMVNRYLASDTAFGEGDTGYTIRAVSFPGPRLENVAYGVFNITSADGTISPLTFGYQGIGMDLVYKTTRTLGNSTFDVARLVPVWGLEMNTPIIGKIDFSGVDAYYKRVCCP